MKLLAIGLLLVCGLALSIQATDPEAKCGCHDKCAKDFTCPYLVSYLCSDADNYLIAIYMLKLYRKLHVNAVATTARRQKTRRPALRVC